MFYENYLTSDFHTNTVISGRVCLLVKMASKTVIRRIFCDFQTKDPYKSNSVSLHKFAFTDAIERSWNTRDNILSIFLNVLIGSIQYGNFEIARLYHR